MCAEKKSDIDLPAIRVLPLDRSPESVKAWLREVCDGLSVSPTKLAELAEIAHTTISRFLSGKSINKNISPSTIGAISAVVVESIERGDIVSKKQPYEHVVLKSDKKIAEMIANAGSKMTISGLILKSASIRGHIGRGIAQSGREELMWRDVELNILVDPKLILSSLIGMEMREEENKYFRRGDILFCVRDFVAYTMLNVDSFVVVTRKNEQHEIENVLYVCKKDPADAFWLVPTWHQWEPADQIYLGNDIYESLARFDQGYLAVACSLRAELPTVLL